jgi:hypothetical protein
MFYAPRVSKVLQAWNSFFLVHRLIIFLKGIKDQWAQAAIEKQKAADAAATRY